MAKPLRKIGSPGEIGDHSSGLAHQQYSRGGIPRIQAEFPESLKASGGHGAKIERRGTVAADAVRAQRELPVIFHVGAVFPLMRALSRGHQAVGKVKFQ